MFLSFNVLTNQIAFWIFKSDWITVNQSQIPIKLAMMTEERGSKREREISQIESEMKKFKFSQVDDPKNFAELERKLAKIERRISILDKETNDLISSETDEEMQEIIDDSSNHLISEFFDKILVIQSYDKGAKTYKPSVLSIPPEQTSQGYPTVFILHHGIQIIPAYNKTFTPTDDMVIFVSVLSNSKKTGELRPLAIGTTYQPSKNKCLTFKYGLDKYLFYIHEPTDNKKRVTQNFLSITIFKGKRILCKYTSTAFQLAARKEKLPLAQVSSVPLQTSSNSMKTIVFDK